jgi:4-hydroxy-3-polyprenylbenzoate decarboxylase
LGYAIADPGLAPPNSASLRFRIPYLVSVNDTLLKDGIAILIVSFSKRLQGHARKLAEQLLVGRMTESVKFVVMVDEQVDPFDLRTVVWLGANNIDPLRDCFFIERDHEKPDILFIDATRKSLELDNFQREWPNVIVMDDETINAVDAKWSMLGLGPIIDSPSIKYKSLVSREGPLY